MYRRSATRTYTPLRTYRLTVKRIVKKFAVRYALMIQGWTVTETPDIGRLEATEGVEGVLRLLEHCSGNSAVSLLRNKHASVGSRVRILRGLTLHNVGLDFSQLTIGSDCHIGRQTLLDLAGPIRIGDRVTISMRTMILTHMSSGDSLSLPATSVQRLAAVSIEDDVYLGAGTIVLPGVRLNRGCVVGAGAVVTRDVAAGEVVAGNPAMPLKKRIARNNAP